MTDILIPVKIVYAVGVKPFNESKVHFMFNEDDHLSALKFINKMNCTHGLSTGDLYVIEEMSVTE